MPGYMMPPSMEPRPHERGNLRPYRDRIRELMPSMEPRPHERGNHAQASLRQGEEARALQWSHVLTNVETTRARASCRRSTWAHFNGATSSRTWKRSSPCSSFPTCNGTSMEPRPHERGNPSGGRRRAAWLRSTSMEPRPHERGNLEGDEGARQLQVTSMEPRPHERGNAHHQFARRHPLGTSMEPRPHERGNVVDVNVYAHSHLTSMEPRPHERGNLAIDNP